MLFILNCNQAPLSPTFLTLIRKLKSEYWSQIHALFYLGILSWEPSWVICKFWWQQGLYNLPVRLSLIEDIFSGTEVIARPQPEGQLTDQVRPTLLCVQLLSHRISFILYSIPHIYHSNISHWQYIQCTLYISRKYHSLIQYTLYGCTPYHVNMSHWYIFSQSHIYLVRISHWLYIKCTPYIIIIHWIHIIFS